MTSDENFNFSKEYINAKATSFLLYSIFSAHFPSSGQTSQTYRCPFAFHHLLWTGLLKVLGHQSHWCGPGPKNADAILVARRPSGAVRSKAPQWFQSSDSSLRRSSDRC